MNKLIVCVLPLMTACVGGGDSGSGLPGSDTILADPTPATAVNGCSTAYHNEVLGTFDGQFSYRTDRVMCTWEVEISIAGATVGHPENPQCDMQMFFGSTLVESDMANSPSSCIEVNSAADIAIPFGPMQAANPPWPVDTFAELFTETPDRTISPLGGAAPENGGKNLFRIRFDGRGNITLPDSHDLEPEWSGVLVKQ